MERIKMGSRKGIISVFIAAICLFIGGIVMQVNASAYFNPQVKQSNGNWMQCYALQYEKKTGGHTATVVQIGHVASTEQICAYVNSEGKIVSKIGKASEPSATNSLKDDQKGKIYFEVKNDNTIDFYQCNDGSSDLDCTSGLAQSWTTTKDGTMSFEELAKEINEFANNKFDVWTKMPFSNNSNSATYTQELSTELGTGDDESTSEIVKDCSNQGGAQSLGWIICPIMTLLGEAAEGIYNGAVEPALRVEPKLFSDANSNVEDAWSVFRNIANVIFVILMLVVIFSQLTGVGIDNYGIKKILPKLIVVAVLINLSYILCVLAVDVSNILGNSFQNLFRALSDGMSLKMEITGADIAKEVLVTGGTIVGIAILGELVHLTGDIWMNRYVAIALLVGALGVVISIFFLFILLAAREAAIVVLTVLAPVAMVLYALPNTKGVFNKWLKMFEGLLLVYPIAGLLVGGGDFVSSLLLSAGMNDFFGSLTAMVAGILPIFFIPTVLKNSFSALGGLGARISSMGDRVSGSVTGGIRGSEAYKGLQDRNLQYARRKKFEQGQRLLGQPGRLNAFRRGMMGGSRGIVRTGAQVERDRQQTAQDDADAMDYRYGSLGLHDTTTPDGQTISGLETMFQNACNAGNTEDASALARVITKRYGSNGMNVIANHLRGMDTSEGAPVEQRNNNRAIIGALRQTLGDDTNFANIMKSKTGDMYDMISSGGMDDNGVYRNAAYFTNRMGSSGPVTSVADWATQSGATLRAAIDSGALGAETINELLNSDVAEVKAALQGDPSKRDILQAAAYNHSNGTNLADREAAQRFREELQRDAEAEANRVQEQRDRVEQTLAEINQKLNNH